MQQLIDELGIIVTKTEDVNLLCTCPACGGENKLSVNSETGAWRCFTCDVKGYPYQLIKLYNPDMKPAEIFDKVNKSGMGSNSITTTKPKEKDISWVTKRASALTEQDVEKFAKAKNLSVDSIKRLGVYRLMDDKVFIPAFCPSTMLKKGPCGVIIATDDGSKIPLADGSEVKYQNQGNHGLVAMPWLSKQDKKEPIIYAEGWGDAAACLGKGVQATASISGCGSWDKWGGWDGFFEGRDVWVVFDRDKAGQNWEQKRANTIKRAGAKSVHVVNLPFEYQEKSGKDLKDWINENPTGDIMAMLQSNEIDFVEEAEIEVIQDDNVAIPTLEDDQPDTVAMGFERWSKEHCGCRHRYHQADGWSIYHKNRYQRVMADRSGKPLMIEKYLRLYLQKATYFHYVKGKKDDEGYNEERKFSAKHKTRGYIDNVLVWLRDMKGVHLMPSQIAPCSLDRKLNPETTLAVKNGLLDWSGDGYVLNDHSDAYYTFNYLDFEWDENADCQQWIQFLVQATGDDDDLFALLTAWAGYLLMSSTKEQKFVILYGEGATGKSVYSDILTALLGVSNVSAVPLSKFDDPHHVTRTYGKMLNLSDEAEATLKEEIEANLKHYTGGTLFPFKRMYESPFDAYPTAKVMIVVNTLLGFKDLSDGIWRRIILMPFNNIVPKTQMNKNLADEIKATQMPGVLKWALSGAKYVLNKGLEVPEICEEYLEEYRTEAVPEIGFFKNYYTEGEGGMSVRDIRYDYKVWCEGEGLMEKGQRKLNQTMSKLFPNITKRQRRDEVGNREWYYDGLIRNTKLIGESEL